MTCAICSEAGGTQHIFREMMFGTRDEFAYWECSTCGCLQIASVPQRLDDYYPPDYYSFADELTAQDIWWYRVFFMAPGLAPLLRRARADPYFADQKFQAVTEAKPKRGARILDVGSGAGNLVKILRSVGFDAHGIDAYAKTESPYLHRTTLERTENGWDLILFHHSLEHMADNVGALRSAREKLAPGGTCLVRIPVAAWAWKHYGKNWVQLDAPRHLVIHTLESFRRAAELAGFQISHVTFDSTIFQFYGSDLYARDIPLKQLEQEKARMTKATLRSDIARAADLNRQQLGDQAAFYLKASTPKRGHQTD